MAKLYKYLMGKNIFLIITGYVWYESETRNQN